MFGLKYRNELTRLRRHKQLKVSVFVGALVCAALFVSQQSQFFPEIVKSISAAGTPPSQLVPANYLSTPQVLAEDSSTFASNLEVKDTRAHVLDEYFRVNNSPMYGTGGLIIKMCEKYKAPQDCLIVAAIADAETDLCKYHISASYYNCWGFGGGGANRIYFNSWERSIEAVYRTLATSSLYGNDVMIDPRKMERTFCGWEPGCTGWGNRVIFFMDEIDAFAKRMGVDEGMYGFR